MRELAEDGDRVGASAMKRLARTDGTTSTTARLWRTRASSALPIRSRARHLEAKLTMSMQLLIQTRKGRAARTHSPQAAPDCAEPYLKALHQQPREAGVPSDIITSGIRAGYPCGPGASTVVWLAAGQDAAAQRRRPVFCPGVRREPAAGAPEGRRPGGGTRARPGAGGGTAGQVEVDAAPGLEDLLVPAELTGLLGPAKIPAGSAWPDGGDRPARSGHLPPPSPAPWRARQAGCGTATGAGTSCSPRFVPALPRHQPGARVGTSPAAWPNRPWMVLP